MEVRGSEVTELLIEWREGDAAALDRLMPLVYAELHRLARAYLRRERADHTLDPTELVHEAYLRLVDRTHPQWRDRTHFYAVAAKLMRRILVDHARSLHAEKRGGGVVKLALEDVGEPGWQRAADLIALDDALKALEAVDERKGRVVELRFFAGLSLEETADFLGVARATVISDLRLARAWLGSALAANPGPPAAGDV